MPPSTAGNQPRMRTGLPPSAAADPSDAMANGRSRHRRGSSSNVLAWRIWPPLLQVTLLPPFTSYQKQLQARLTRKQPTRQTGLPPTTAGNHPTRRTGLPPSAAGIEPTTRTGLPHSTAGIQPTRRPPPPQGTNRRRGKDCLLPPPTPPTTP